MELRGYIGIGIAIVVIVCIIIGVIFWKSRSSLLSSTKSSPQCPFIEEKNNESFFREKMSKIEDKKNVKIFTNLVVSKLYNDSENYDEFVSAYGEITDHVGADKIIAREEMKASYNIIIEQYGYPKCILTQTQLSACKEVLDDLLKALN